MRKEYPPMLSGKPEEQATQLRDYLVRLIEYLDETFHSLDDSIPSESEKQELHDWQNDTDSAISALRATVKTGSFVLHGSAEAAGSVSFPKAFAEPPVVFTTAGNASSVTTEGFSISAAAQWIAVGSQRR